MIRTLLLVEWLIIGIGLLLIITQVMVPAVHGKPLFPLLRKRGREMEARLAAAKERKELHELDQSIKDVSSKPAIKRRK